jgi:phospholipid transport system substrate-binding protein
MVLRRLLFVIFVLGALVGTSGTPQGAIATDPAAFISSLANETLKVLGEQLPPTERERRFKVILLENFDMPRISRFVLGRYWVGSSDQEKQDFQSLLPDYVARSYSNRFMKYSGETVKVTRSRAADRDATVVSSQIISSSSAPPIDVDWRVVRMGNDYRITDVIVDGVSLVLTHRQEFAAVIERQGGGVSTLNRTLREKLAGSTAAP